MDDGRTIWNGPREQWSESLGVLHYSFVVSCGNTIPNFVILSVLEIKISYSVSVKFLTTPITVSATTNTYICVHVTICELGVGGYNRNTVCIHLRGNRIYWMEYLMFCCRNILPSFKAAAISGSYLRAILHHFGLFRGIWLWVYIRWNPRIVVIANLLSLKQPLWPLLLTWFNFNLSMDK